MREADAVRKSAPFPARERAALSNGISRAGDELGVCLSRKRDWITGDGRFATELQIGGNVSGSIMDRNQVIRQIRRRVCFGALWQRDNDTSLRFKTKLQVNALKNPRQPNQTHRQILNFSGALPPDPIAGAILSATAYAVETANGVNDLNVLGEIPVVATRIFPFIGRGLSGQAKESIKNRVATVDVPPLQRVEDLCGPEGNALVSLLVPDRPLGFDFRPACQAHDERYATLDFPKDKADELFLSDLLRICDKEFPRNVLEIWKIERYFLCINLAYIYYYFVQLFGHFAYNDSQAEARRLQTTN